jgi:hypothetical protein
VDEVYDVYYEGATTQEQRWARAQPQVGVAYRAETAKGRTLQQSQARQQQSRNGNGAASSSSSSSSAREHVSAASPANTGRVTNTTQPRQSQARQQQSRNGNGAASSSSSSSSAREHVSAASPANTGRVTNTTQPRQSQARQMVQLTLTNVDRAQKNKRNLDNVTVVRLRFIYYIYNKN